MQKFKSILLLPILVILCHFGRAQKINPITFNKYENDSLVPYKKKDGSFIGCGYTYECRGMEIKFYLIELDSSKHRLRMSGRIYDPRQGEKGGITGVEIFLARPFRSRLKNIRDKSMPIIINDSSVTEKESYERYGDFVVDCIFSVLDRLYFVHPLFRPIEFNIGLLLKDITSQKL